MPTRPDILLVVADCARIADFPGTSRNPPRMPFVESMLRESTSYTRAVSPSNWTLPSHASLFTGTYPWGHGVFSSGAARLPDVAYTMASALKARGYRAASLSANPFVSPLTGLTAGFDLSLWGSFADCFLRQMPWVNPPHSSATLTNGRTEQDVEVLAGRTSSATRVLREFALRAPLPLDATTRLVGRLARGSSTAHVGPAAWMEAQLESWLSSIEASRPVLCFLNLLDAHEPYIGVDGGPWGPDEWISCLTTRQDGLHWFDGNRRCSPIEYSNLRTLYRRSMQTLDLRIGRLIESFRRFRDWDNTLFILTSDHGQSFGEDGFNYHGTGSSEALLRVPLMVRWKGVFDAGRSVQAWVSTKNIFSLVNEAATSGTGLANSAAQRPISGEISDGEPPVLALADVPVPLGGAALGQAAATISKEFSVVGYRGTTKVAVRILGTGQEVYTVRNDGTECVAMFDPSDSDQLGLVNELRVIRDRIRSSIPALHASPKASALDSWGY